MMGDGRSPPSSLVAVTMQLLMMVAAERGGELIADLETQGSGLSKAQVVRVGGLTAADEAGL